MANQKDLVVKMTINSQDFDSGLKNAKASMDKMQQQTISVGQVFKKTMGAMAKAAAGLGVAVGATEIAKSFIKSTQTMSDAWNNTMVAAKVSYQSFATAVMSGNADLIRNFRSLISAANEFAEASDALGSAQISQRYSRLTYLNPLNQALVNAQEKGIAPEQKKAYIEEAKGYYNEYSASVKNVAEKARAEMLAWLKVQLPEYNITEQNMKPIIDNLYKNVINGIYDAATQRYLQVTGKDFWKGNVLVNSKADRIKSGEALMRGEGYSNEQIAIAKLVSKLKEIPDQKLNENLDILETEVNATAELISLQRRINRAIGEAGGGETSFTTPQTESMTQDQIMEYLRTKLQNEILAGDRAKDSILLDIEIEDIDIVEDDTDVLIKKVKQLDIEWQNNISTMNQYASALGSMASAFNSLSQIAADGSPWQKFMSLLGSVAGEIAGLISTYSSLVAVESVAESIRSGQGIPFPYNLAAMAAAAAAIAGIIASASSTFAGNYAEGGIVGGTSYSGDKLWARVNSGEMILNRQQQATLFNSGGDVKFVIEGSQLKGVLDNYEIEQNL